MIRWLLLALSVVILLSISCEAVAQGVTKEMIDEMSHDCWSHGSQSRPPGPDLSEYYNACLEAFEEQPLGLTAQCGRECYRFLWLRTFNRPVLLRFSNYDGSYCLSYKELEGQSGYQIGALVVNKEIQLDAKQWAEIKAILTYADFYTLEPYDLLWFGFDGAYWVLEGRCDTHYHLVDRWSPGLTAYREACIQLLRYSGVTFGQREIY